MRVARAAALTLGGAGAAALLACASAGRPEPLPCSGFVPPRLISAGPLALPITYKTAGVGGKVIEEVVIARDGSPRELRTIGSSLELLVPFAEASLQRSRFSAATLEGNPVAARCVVTTEVGASERMPAAPRFSSLQAFVPGGESREARWQLAGSVQRLTLQARLGAPLPGGAQIVARSSDGAERILEEVSATAGPQEFRQTVKGGAFFARPSDYKIEIREAGKVIASTTFTVAADFTTAIVNCCEPLGIPAPR